MLPTSLQEKVKNGETLDTHGVSADSTEPIQSEERAISKTFWENRYRQMRYLGRLLAEDAGQDESEKKEEIPISSEDKKRIDIEEDTANAYIQGQKMEGLSLLEQSNALTHIGPSGFIYPMLEYLYPQAVRKDFARLPDEDRHILYSTVQRAQEELSALGSLRKELPPPANQPTARELQLRERLDIVGQLMSEYLLNYSEDLEAAMQAPLSEKEIEQFQATPIEYQILYLDRMRREYPGRDTSAVDALSFTSDQLREFHRVSLSEQMEILHNLCALMPVRPYGRLATEIRPNDLREYISGQNVSADNVRLLDRIITESLTDKDKFAQETSETVLNKLIELKSILKEADKEPPRAQL